MTSRLDHTGRVAPPRLLPSLLRAGSDLVLVLDPGGDLLPTDGRIWPLLGLDEPSGQHPLRFAELFPGVRQPVCPAPGCAAPTDFNPVQLQRPDGRRIWVLLKTVALPPPDRGQHLLLIQEPSTIRRIVDRLDYVEDHDPATGLLSRNRGRQELRQLLATGMPGCSLLISVQGNVPLPRATLERGLLLLVEGCRAVPGLEPVIARHDQNELLVLSLHPQALPSEAAVQALKASLTERLTTALRAEIPRGGAGLSVETGFARWDNLGHGATAILEALRLDQGSGPGGETSGGTADHRELVRALEAGEMVFHIEPQVRAWDGAITGGELLIRWQHPDRGLIFPGAFIEGLEAPRCADAFLRWSVDTAVAVARQLRASLGSWFPLSLNIPGSAFGPRLLRLLQERAQAAGLPPQMLELEITERLIAEDAAQSLACLQGLHAAGFRIAVDDFGTGYSSLSYIRNVPLDRLKVDRAFVLGIAESEEDRLITTAIISLSRVLDIGVVVEGVETAEQAQILRDLGAETYQGYLFGRAMPVADFAELVGRGQPSVVASGATTGEDPIDFDTLQRERLRQLETVVWKRSFSTDLVSVDDEHRALINLLNSLSNTMREASTNLDVAIALDHLARETHSHFQHEEQVMANIGYDRLAIHRSCHADLLAEFGRRRDSLVQQFRQGEFEALIAYLKVWLLQHLVSEDTRLHRFLNRSGGQPA